MSDLPEIVTFDQVFQRLRLDGDHWNVEIEPLIAAATEAVVTACPGWDRSLPVPAVLTLAALAHVEAAFQREGADLPADALRLLYPYRTPSV